MADSPVSFQTEQTRLLGGRVACLQPVKGYRTAIDAVLMAAAVPAKPGDRVLEFGAGVGAAAYCLTARAPECQVTGVDNQPDLIALAKSARALNDSGNVPTFDCRDVKSFLKPPSAPVDHVMMNPPYRRPDQGTPPPDPLKRAAMVEGGTSLSQWIDAAFTQTRDGGTVTVVFDWARVREFLAAAGRRPNSAVILPFLGKKSSSRPKRFIYQGVKGDSGRVGRMAPFVLHEENGAFTEAANACLRDAKPLIFQLNDSP